ncbi:MAG: hypothetical protein H6810_09895 [Phycisphaeraceae bacterium]|nr:MAG: hypothetical protein H6810_09895 [Phycisphaeraceae bacterium]
MSVQIKDARGDTHDFRPPDKAERRFLMKELGPAHRLRTVFGQVTRLLGLLAALMLTLLIGSLLPIWMNLLDGLAALAVGAALTVLVVLPLAVFAWMRTAAKDWRLRRVMNLCCPVCGDFIGEEGYRFVPDWMPSHNVRCETCGAVLRSPDDPEEHSIRRTNAVAQAVQAAAIVAGVPLRVRAKSRPRQA